MADYRAVFAAGRRRRTVEFRSVRSDTRAELEREARAHLAAVTTIPVADWEVVSLERTDRSSGG